MTRATRQLGLVDPARARADRPETDTALWPAPQVLAKTKSWWRARSFIVRVLAPFPQTTRPTGDPVGHLSVSIRKQKQRGHPGSRSSQSLRLGKASANRPDNNSIWEELNWARRHLTLGSLPASHLAARSALRGSMVASSPGGYKGIRTNRHSPTGSNLHFSHDTRDLQQQPTQLITATLLWARLLVLV
jgi:hypothetical protein